MHKDKLLNAVSAAIDATREIIEHTENPAVIFAYKQTLDKLNNVYHSVKFVISE